MQATCKQRLILFLIIAAFVVPMIAAYMTYLAYQDGGFRTTNRGTFVEPPVNVGQFIVNKADNQVCSIADLNGKRIRDRWILLYLVPEGCEEQCANWVYYLNQLYTAMGKNRPYLQSMVMLPDGANFPEPGQANVLYTTAPSEKIQNLINELPAENRPNHKGAIYLIDPHGFLMMYYAADDNPDDILKDMQHLIKG